MPSAVTSSPDVGCRPGNDRGRWKDEQSEIEKYVIESGIILIKIWLEVGQEEQERRFRARMGDPLRQWKLSPMDLESYKRWYDYSAGRDAMLDASDSKHAPWSIIRSNDKRRARLNCISRILWQSHSSGSTVQK